MEYNIVDAIMMLNEECCHLNESGTGDNGLTAKDLQVILTIKPAESVSGSDLAKRNNLSPSRMSRITDRLVNHGLLTREIDGHDRRFSRVSLTPEGINMRARAVDFKKQCESKIKSRLSEHEFAIIQKALHLLLFAMENEYENDIDANDPAKHH